MNFSIKQAIKQAILPKAPQAVTVPFGIYRNLRLEIDFQAHTQLYLGLEEFETHRFIRSMLRKSVWLIDVGAGGGELAILFARRSDAKIFAVEPGPLRAKMQRNIAANDLSEGTVTTIERRIGPNAPDCLPLDQIPVDRHSAGFVKIDVDGGELDVLRSGEALLDARSACFLVETHSESLERDCIALLKSFGYACDIIPNAWWRAIIPERRPRPHNRWLSATA